jgi:SAM-dependent methyltransferase
LFPFGWNGFAFCFHEGISHRAAHDHALYALQKRLDGLDCIADGQALPFKNGQFDLVFMVAVDYYIPNIELSFYEIYRVLKPEGFFINATYTQENLERQARHDPFVATTLSTSNYLALSDRIGFETWIKHIVNNVPKNVFKKIIWSLFPRQIKLRFSQWRVFINKRR